MPDFFAVNGRVLPAEEATISVLDLGFLRGVGAFETFRTYGGGHPHALTEHLRRLWTSAEALGMSPCLDEAQLRSIVADIHRRSGHEELRVNLIVTPGEHTHGVFGSATPTWVIIARDLHAPSPELYQTGATAITFSAERHLPQHKTTNYLVGRTGLLAAEKAGAHEAFYVDTDGHVTEGVTSNLCLLHGTNVITPVENCLHGITKDGVRPLAESLGLGWNERSITRADLYAADEVWITSAVREILPIVVVDGHRIGSGQPGAYARRLRPLYHQACIDAALRDARAAGMA